MTKKIQKTSARKRRRGKGVKTIAMTGADGGKMKPLSDLLINVPSTDTPRIQEAHITIGHIICEMVEKAIFGEKKRWSASFSPEGWGRAFGA